MFFSLIVTRHTLFLRAIYQGACIEWKGKPKVLPEGGKK
jgi:hypothetical protein